MGRGTITVRCYCVDPLLAFLQPMEPGSLEGPRTTARPGTHPNTTCRPLEARSLPAATSARLFPCTRGTANNTTNWALSNHDSTGTRAIEGRD